MQKLLLFENMKFWRAKKTIVVLMVFVSALIGMVLYNTAQDEAYWDGQQRNVAVERTRIDLLIAQVESELESLEISAPEDIEAIAQLGYYLEFIHGQRRLNYQQKIHAQFHSDDKAARLELWIKRDQHLLSGLEEGYEFLGESPDPVQQRLSVNQFLAQENIEPLNSPYEMTATNFAFQLTEYPWLLIILVTIAVLNTDMFSSDFEGGAFKVLYTQPFGRSKVLTAKYLVRLTNSFIVVTGLAVIVFGVVAIRNGIGNMAYPVFYYGGSYQSLVTSSQSSAVAGETLTFLTWSAYILRTLPLYSLLCCFVISFIGTASLLLKNTANVFNALFGWLFLDFSTRTVFSHDSVFYFFWPFAASGLNTVLQGSYSMSALAYVIMLGLLSSVFLAGSLIFLNKQDLTGGNGI